jgi:hypothetical protein
MLMRVERAGALRDIDLAGILWYQGEADADDLGLARTYAARFDAWVAEARSDLDDAALPVHVVQLGRAVRAGLGDAHPRHDVVDVRPDHADRPCVTAPTR